MASRRLQRDILEHSGKRISKRERHEIDLDRTAVLGVGGSASEAKIKPILESMGYVQFWAADEARRKKDHVPDNVIFKTKPQIALDQIKAALAAGVARRIV